MDNIKKRMIDIVQDFFARVAQDITPFTSFYIFFHSEKPLLPAYNIITTVKNSENPCCQLTPFYTTVKDSEG
jgi:hypothetical protein